MKNIFNLLVPKRHKSKILCVKIFLRGGETMRNLRKLIISVCLIVLLSASTVFGAVIPELGMEPMADNYSTAEAGISFSGSSVTATGKIIGRSGKTTKTSIHLYLQQYKNGSWVNIDDWTSSGETVTRVLSKTKTVTKGYKYRTKAVCAAYVDSDKETVTKYSKSVSL